MFLLPGIANAFSLKTEAYVRNKKFKIEKKSVVLNDLLMEDRFEGKFFKIVLGKSNEALEFSPELVDEKLKIKAATTYYHLSKARKFFVEKMGSQYVTSMPQLTIRLEITNEFNQLGHFAHDNKDPQFNNAQSVPAGSGNPRWDVNPWGYEIWFRPLKKIQLKNSVENGSDELAHVLKTCRKTGYRILLDRFIMDMVQGLMMGSKEALIASLVRNATSVVLIEASFLTMKGIYGGFASKKHYFLDSALVPEIIYHEFAHIALSDKIDIKRSTPVNEGMADYFAARIANNPKLAKKIRKFSSAQGKNARTNIDYQSVFETADYANIDFVLSLLWDVKEMVPKESDQLIFSIRKDLDSNSNIRDDLVRALLNGCQTNCVNPMGTRYKLFKLFNSRGL